MKLFSRLFFLLCLPALIWHAPLHSEAPLKVEVTEDYRNFSPWDLLKYENLSFDRIMNFIDEVEYGHVLERCCSEQQFLEILDFIIFLVRNGIPSWDTEGKEQLERDIEKLLSDDDDDDDSEEASWWYSNFNGYQDIMITPALFRSYDKPQVMRCKNWFGKEWKKTTKFIKNHKKAVIIAAVVVVAATVIIIATSGAAPPLIAGGAATAGAAGGSKSSSDDKEKTRTPVNKPGEVQFGEDRNPPPPPDNSYTGNTPPPLKEAIIKQSEEIKGELSEIIPDEALNITKKDEPSFWGSATDKAKKTGAHITHEVYETVTDQLEIIPQVSGAFSDILPDPLKNTDPFDKDPREAYHEKVEAGHEKIDEIFGTDQSDMYAAEGKAARGELTTGMLPPPGSIGNTKKSVNPVNRSSNHQHITFVEKGQTKAISIGKMSHAGTSLDKGDLTKAGRALQKHGARIDSSFPKPTGNTTEINLQGQKILDEILNHPNKKIILDEASRSKEPVIDIFIPNGHGARFTRDGKEMIGFLEPKK
ncbi:MAG: hypothetical protein KFB93_05830 [Simkaniaceae bacterium]|nr:MAG: hypothetical protein KFB93_05830 [Simkaniaceae bacterium]